MPCGLGSRMLGLGVKALGLRSGGLGSRGLKAVILRGLATTPYNVNPTS